MKLDMFRRFCFAVLLMLLSINNFVHAQDWPVLNYNKERTSWVTEETALIPPLVKKGEYLLKAGGNDIGDITMYNSAGLYALDRTTGEQKWMKPVGPLYTKNLVIDADLGRMLLSDNCRPLCSKEFR